MQCWNRILTVTLSKANSKACYQATVPFVSTYWVTCVLYFLVLLLVKNNWLAILFYTRNTGFWLDNCSSRMPSMAVQDALVMPFSISMTKPVRPVFFVQFSVWYRYLQCIIFPYCDFYNIGLSKLSIALFLMHQWFLELV